MADCQKPPSNLLKSMEAEILSFLESSLVQPVGFSNLHVEIIKKMNKIK